MDRREERIRKILHILKIYRAGTIRDLARELDVSEMTIRRDLQVLSQDSLVRVLHGGAIYNGGPEPDGPLPRYSLLTEGEVKTEEKQRIGRKAAAMIERNDIVIIDSGSTTEYLARSIPTEMPITVLCYSINNLFEVSRKGIQRIIFPGGYFHDNIRMFESVEGVELIRRNRATKAFMAARGVSERLGVTTANQYEIEIKKAAMRSSLSNILLIDSTKFGQVGSAYFADLHDFSDIVTDDGIPEEYRRVVEGLGIRLHVV